jgi:hypothetical protein
MSCSWRSMPGRVDTPSEFTLYAGIDTLTMRAFSISHLQAAEAVVIYRQTVLRQPQ